jgi:SAM-dependent methyltransferase
MILETTEAHYSGKVIRHGASHLGVDWGSKEGQEIRFEQLLRCIPVSEANSIIDFGCGYGGLIHFLHRSGFNGNYLGYDLSEPMIQKARGLFKPFGERYRFTTHIHELTLSEYVVSSGIFNVKLDTPDEDWLPYMLHTLSVIERLSAAGFAFNVLSANTPHECREETLYYADPKFIVNYCKRTFRAEAHLYSDYPLPDFTVYVDLNSRLKEYRK